MGAMTHPIFVFSYWYAQSNQTLFAKKQNHSSTNP
jgi:hypothetical protein